MSIDMTKFLLRATFEALPAPMNPNLVAIPWRATARTFLNVGLTVMAVGACGGGGSSAVPAPTPIAAPAPPPAAPTPAPAPSAGPPDTERSAAASATANSSSNACAAIRPFYWEIGDAVAAKASGSANVPGGTVYTATTPLPLASASKWFYAAYVAELRQGAMTPSDINFLTLRSGYTSFDGCSAGQTIDRCLAAGTNGVYTAANDGKFSYGGGHMEKHASLIGLGAMDNAALTTELQSRLGSDIALAFYQPQPAGGIGSTAADYARLLRKMLTGQLRLGSLLGTQAVCTNPSTCPQAVFTPVPRTESWHYSLGHWVEDDPVVGDGAFSSAGSFGFYPWISADKTLYGILARRAPAGNGSDSATCGRLIRKAWVTALPQ